MNAWKVTVLLLCGCLFTSYVFYGNKEKEIKTLQDGYVQYAKEIDSLSFYKYNFELNGHFSGTKMKNIKCTNRADSFEICEYVKNNTVLVYRYTDHNCNPCVDKELHLLDSLFTKDIDKLLILCSYDNDRNYKILKNTYKKSPVFMVHPGELDWSIEELNHPYFFILHPNMKVTDFYIADNQFEKSKLSYLNRVKKYLCD